MPSLPAAAAFGTPPTLDDIAALAEAALGTLPQELRRLAGTVLLRVEDFPDSDTEQEMQLDSPFELLGLYRGRPLTERSVSSVATEPDMVFLYRRPILDLWCEEGEDLATLVRHVLIHEIGHHFGFSDEDMERLEQEAE
ncbi:MAG: metallopeptidase family protein [Alphaproteobacteria bacterium]|nr:metallopeptidase family protein [Alphaproteobacteria bacterium]TAD89579.1 MAG: metallopeptidase family protein [Alphaproteobacteria bacterium]